jgi:tRNA(Arg) A34 adenosine deaminase TadA
MVLLPSDFTLAMPEWCGSIAGTLPAAMERIDERVALVIRLSRLNIEHDTGGPFAAGVFESKTGKIISLGVNRVMPFNCSCAHAEIMAISLAQKALGTYDLGGKSMVSHDLIVNWLPCAMCFGALLWSGAKRLIIAGHGPELERLTGFDEGPRPDNWEKELTARGIEVISGILRDEALAVFRKFQETGKTVYNARQDKG